MLFVEWGKRLYFSDGSIEAAVLSSFGPRGGAPWISRRNELGNLGDQFAFLDITNIVLPLAGVLFAYILTMTRVMRSICLGGWLVVLTTLIADGNRTPVVAVLGMSALFYVLREKRWAWRLAGAAILAIVAAAATSAMYLFRSEGWGQLAEGGGDSYHIMYHQDDNYRQALLALERSLNTNERWSPLEFAYVIAVNPIPRAMWSEKPALLADYWGNYKNEWTTITFVGELVAMFGFWAGIALSVPIALLAYLVISASARLLERPGGLIVYMLMALYGYMVLRSLLNISQFIYLPAAALAALWILSPFSRALDRRDGYRALPS
jgi:oligosaccharide repeat unit polymerase